MMNEQRRTDVQKKLDDEERIRRMKEGGEDMRAELEMEQAERSRRGEAERGSDLGPEEERARQAERGAPYRGMGETQQAQMASWGKEGAPRQPAEGEQRNISKEEMRRTGSDAVGYRAGTGSYYPESPERPVERASTGEPFTSGPNVPGTSEKRYMSKEEMRRTGSDAVGYRAGTGSYYPESPERPVERASTGEPFTSGPAMERPSERRSMSKEEMRRTGSDAVGYPAGTGSYYPESPERPVERASTGESFTSGPDIAGRAGTAERPSDERYMSKEEMRRTGSDAVGYRAGTGSYYPESPEAPVERASTGESFTSGPRMQEPSERRYISKEEMRRTGSDAVEYRAGTGSYYSESPEAPLERASTGEYFTTGPDTLRSGGVIPAPEGRMGQAQAQQPSMTSTAVSKVQGVTHMVTEKAKSVDTGGMTSTVVSKGKDVSHMVTSKAKEFNESNKAEDIAARAGETIGKAIRKTVAVAKGMSSGLRKGMSGEHAETGPGAERETVERESTIRESPEMEERRYQEVRRKEQQ